VTSHDPETVRRLLERDLIEWADDTSLRLVWADLLQQGGDPLGRLVMLDHAGEQKNQASKQARAEAETLRHQLAPRLWSSGVPSLTGIELHWQLGFVRECEIIVSKLENLQAPEPEVRTRRGRIQKPARAGTNQWLIPQLLRQPAFQWIESVRVVVADDYVRQWSGWIYSGVMSPTLREIHIGTPPRASMRPRGPWETGGNAVSTTMNVDGLVRWFPRLRWFSLAGELQRVPTRDGNSQARMHHVRKLATRPLSSSNRASLARALWDSSSTVHEAAFASARALGPRAEFLIEDLAWFLRPPLSRKDPRPSQALLALAAIGQASAVLLPEVLQHAAVLTETHERRESVMRWLASLGRLAEPARKLVDAVLAQPTAELPKPLREAAKKARKAIDGE
jgi:hypothetical protein